ncbi:phage tail assembly protein [Pararhodobacter sp.]|uniref:phage tail assembly protein n=1 Tax=Pararhodobacter sp. TaxID=2127056 RepID=UPI002AFE1847|nr:phage tail assembly protein [Pararhodobacter sp.]
MTKDAAIINLDDLPNEDAGRDTGPATVIDEDGTVTVVDEDAELGGGLPVRAILNPDGTVTLPLRKPVALTVRSARHGDRTETYDKLSFRGLVGADIRAVSAASEASRLIVLMARATGIREAVMNALFDRMDGGDIMDAQECVQHFFGNGKQTKTRS